ncbi:PDZ domain-containing protein [Allobranchiibius sp. CTAmp26]|uniref:YlbL family protein n=1 Tax=Allobranchiibius sp. CTAmp26 TaxID=2815214 RepID=UPI001AA15A25|nr:PDZ domain-containing protein [Allobranchiibius sp. CTAmp26]MBO1755732.1 PDZ domain-containing protein [Allobranchiibius sp. CTAmp26]
MTTSDDTGDARREGGAGTSRLGGLRPRTVVWLVVAVVLVLVVAALNLIHVPVAILRPGPAQNTLGDLDGRPVISISGHPTYPTSGSLDFTTVSLAGGPQYPVTVWEWATAHLNSNAQIVPADEYFPKNVTSRQVQQQDSTDMADSQQTAQVLALRTAGIQVPETVSVGLLSPGSPAAKYLKVSDVVRSIDGTPLTRLATARAVLDKVPAGTTVTLQITRAGKPLTVRIKTAKNPQGKGSLLGFYPVPNYTLPFKVDVNAGDVGGPSAGNMFTLAIYDKLTPGSLTGGKKFAGTGTIAEDGSVGPIGGIRQKMVGAHDSGAKYFLAPAADCSEAHGHIPSGLTVIKIASFAQAVSAVKMVAAGQGSGLPSC